MRVDLSNDYHFWTMMQKFYPNFKIKSEIDKDQLLKYAEKTLTMDVIRLKLQRDPNGLLDSRRRLLREVSARLNRKKFRVVKE